MFRKSERVIRSYKSPGVKPRDRRLKKRIVNRKVKKIGKYGYFEDCNFHPCKMTILEVYGVWDSGVDGVSLVDGRHTSCNLYYCNALPLTEKEADERAEFWRNHDLTEYLNKYYA